eukprot:CAMPEP_0180173990 /NCGR_PEP_ID=MMETSP0986-20121125/35891_1 /TAXON_ID=697907 /ORGANISM="non described non described, Strain CCMP2293" /LENGTH=43 /DNA_ID= /DNA_START= /DNA_END= /DNA_ORIENTATION=
MRAQVVSSIGLTVKPLKAWSLLKKPQLKKALHVRDLTKSQLTV